MSLASMMTNTALREAVDFIDSRWGHDKAWDNWADFYEEFSPFTNGAVRQALHEWFRAGNRFGPKPAELLKAVAEVQRRRIEQGVDEIPTICVDHVWALPFFHEKEAKVCVRCGEERR